MKKVLLIMPYGSVGGMERLALYFYNYFKAHDIYVKGLKIIRLENDIINFNEDELFLSDKDFSEMSAKNRMLFYLKCPFAIRKIIKNHQITHSISFGDMSNVFNSLTFTKNYKIGSIHSYKSKELISKNLWNTISKVAYKTSYKYLDKCVCISQAVKDDLIENCGYRFKHNLSVIYNPHNIDKIRSMGKEPIDEISEEVKERFIVFVGRISLVKAPWHLIKAFKLHLEKFPQTKLVFLGDGAGECQEYIQELITTLGIEDSILFLGRHNNPFKFIKAAKLLALSSYYEGTPNVIIEALALGTPVVTSNCTKGLLEIMDVGKTDGEINHNLMTAYGIITPTFFKGSLSFPDMTKDFITEEVQFSEALNTVFETDQFYKDADKLKKHLELFEVSHTISNYLDTKAV